MYKITVEKDGEKTEYNVDGHFLIAVEDDDLVSSIDCDDFLMFEVYKEWNRLINKEENNNE
jgi:hypothetical protein